jgi:hypothetical protein
MLNKICFVALLMVVSGSFALGQSAIRKVNFKNFTYMPYCAGEAPEKVTVKNGEYSYEKQVDGYTDRFYFGVQSPVYGDVNNDKQEDAIILSTCNTGGTGQFTEGFVYAMKAGKAVLIGRIPGGDRAYGGLRDVKIANGVVTVEANDVSEVGGACCPEFVVTSNFKWNGKKLVEFGKSTRRELYPAQTVAFARGASQALIKTTVAEIKRFKVGARAGQTMTVKVTSPNINNIYLSLVSGDAMVTEGEHSFTAKLKETGDFVIQVQNSYKLDAAVTLTIEIR